MAAQWQQHSQLQIAADFSTRDDRRDDARVVQMQHVENDPEPYIAGDGTGHRGGTALTGRASQSVKQHLEELLVRPTRRLVSHICCPIETAVYRLWLSPVVALRAVASRAARRLSPAATIKSSLILLRKHRA